VAREGGEGMGWGCRVCDSLVRITSEKWEGCREGSAVQGGVSLYLNELCGMYDGLWGMILVMSLWLRNI